MGWRSLSISEHHGSCGLDCPPTIYLTAGGAGALMAPTLHLMNLFVPKSASSALQVGSPNKHVHLPDFPPQFLDWRGEKNAVRRKNKTKQNLERPEK